MPSFDLQISGGGDVRTISVTANNGFYGTVELFHNSAEGHVIDPASVYCAEGLPGQSTIDITGASSGSFDVVGFCDDLMDYDTITVP